MKTNHILPLLSLPLLSLFSCAGEKADYDATGTFEATEITVSAEQTGRLVEFTAEEGNRVEAGAQVALIDTVQLALRARQIGATKLVYASQRPDCEAQVAALRRQLQKAREDYARFAELAKSGAGNAKQADDARSQVEVLERQLSAKLSSLGKTTGSLNAQMSTADVERLQVADQLRKCHVASPVTGTVLETYAEQGEFAAVGKPLFRVADTDVMFLRAYLTVAQLKDVAVGKPVKVFADYGNADRQTYNGTVCWISSKAEFTPKTVLTDDERANQVYAIKVRVKNDGKLKIGMYGEVKL